MTHHAITLLPALLLTAPAALAQGGLPPTLPPPTTLNSLRPVGPNAVAESYGRGALLDADGDKFLDAFFLHESQIEAVFAPGVFMSFFDNVKTTASDLAGLKNGAASGNDALLSVSPTGLVQQELTWNGSQPVWLSTTLESSWANATRLETGVLGNQSWVFGLQSDQRTLRGRTSLNGSAWTEGLLFTTGFDVTEIVALDYNGNGIQELCVIGGSRWEIWRRNGSPFAPWVKAASGNQPGYTFLDVAAGQQSGSSSQWIAMLASLDATPAASYIFTRDLSGTVGPEEIDGQPDAVALATGDMDEDGYDDLVISIRSACDVLVSFNLQSSPMFDGNQSGALPPTATINIDSGTFTDNDAHPLVGDIDSDLNADLCLPVVRASGNDELFTFRDPLIGSIESGFDIEANTLGGLTVYDMDQGTGTCSDRVSINVVARPNDLPPTSNTYHIETFLWSKPDGTPTSDTNTQSECYATVVLDPNETSYSLDLALSSNPGCDDEDCSGRDQTIYFFLVCYTEKNAANEVVRVLHPRLHFFQTECEPGSDPNLCDGTGYIEDHRSSDLFNIQSVDCAGLLFQGPGFWTATGASLPCLPDLPPDMPPQINRFCNN